MFRKAEKSLSKARICLAGPAGSGKTYSALLLASGLGSKIAMIDTEHGSGDLYSDIHAYDIVQLSPPFECQKYLDAIKEAEKLNYDVIVVDSLSHAWAGEGGLLDLHTKISNSGKENSYTAWRQITPLHNALIEAMLQSKCHIIATTRAKMDYSVEKDANGRTTIKKVGLQPVFREGVEFEFTTFFDLSQDHTAAVTKDRTALFDGKCFKITRDTGERILKWLNSNNYKPPITHHPQRSESQNNINELSEFIDESFAPKRTRKTLGFLESIEQLKAKVDTATFNQICKPYEPLGQLHDRNKQLELYNKLKDVLVPALV